jgi:hypothetical protein
MKHIAPTQAEQALTQLAVQFDHWRHRRVTRRERIPQSLREQAVALTTVLPLSRVAKCVRVQLTGFAPALCCSPRPGGEATLYRVELCRTPRDTRAAAASPQPPARRPRAARRDTSWAPRRRGSSKPPWSRRHGLKSSS